MATRRWYIDPAGAPINWAAAVTSGVAQTDIIEVVDPDGPGAVFLSLWVSKRQSVATARVTAAQAATSGDALPALARPLPRLTPAQDARVRIVTQAQYDALPAAEKADPTIAWLIPGADGTIGGGTAAPGPQGPPAMVWRGAYNPATTYGVNDGVSYGGRGFIALQGVTGIAPPSSATSTAYWDLLVDRGAPGPAGTGASGVISPSGLSFKAWVADPALIVPGTRSTPVAGQMIGTLLNLPAETVTGVTFFVGVAGATVTNCYIGLIDAATGNRIAVTGDLSSVVTTTGLKRAAFTTPVVAPGGPAYVVLLVGSAATMLQVTRLVNTDSAFVNARGPGQATGRVRSGQITVASGLTAIPATNDMSGSAAQTAGLWAAID